MQYTHNTNLLEKTFNIRIHQSKGRDHMIWHTKLHLCNIPCHRPYRIFTPQAFTRKCEAGLGFVLLGPFILGECPYKEAYHRLLIVPYPRGALSQIQIVGPILVCCDLCNCFQGWIHHYQGPMLDLPQCFFPFVNFVMQQPKWTRSTRKIQPNLAISSNMEANLKLFY